MPNLYLLTSFFGFSSSVCEAYFKKYPARIG
jgi:hypothetical protein